MTNEEESGRDDWGKSVIIVIYLFRVVNILHRTGLHRLLRHHRLHDLHAEVNNFNDIKALNIYLLLLGYLHIQFQVGYDCHPEKRSFEEFL